MALLASADKGWQGAAYLGYAVDHAIEYAGRRDAPALSWTFPVSLAPLRTAVWPGFVMDLLPQGYGRQELLRQLGLPGRAEAGADWRLLLAGAGDPIGNCRAREAYEWLQARDTARSQGFPLAEVAQRGEHFAEYLANYGLFVAGSSGVQGEWPKLLLTEDHSGQFFLDHILQGRALFIPRFDRELTSSGVQRHAQESVYALCQCSGFGSQLTHNAVCTALASGLAAMCEPLAALPDKMRQSGVPAGIVERFAPLCRDAAAQLEACC